MNQGFEYLDTEDLVELARRLLGDPPPIRDIGLLGAAAAATAGLRVRPRRLPRHLVQGGGIAALGGQQPSAGRWQQASRLARAAAVFLELNDASVSAAANDDVYDLVMSVASSDIGVEDIAEALRAMGDTARSRLRTRN